VPRDLAVVKGYKNQICIDFSPIVIELMKSRFVDVVSSGSVEWIQGDVRDMTKSIPSKSIDVAFDKGTLDAMIHGSPWNPPDTVMENTGKYMDEARNVCK
jgi:EEF1A lysine methyltransferase 4